MATQKSKINWMTGIAVVGALLMIDAVVSPADPLIAQASGYIKNTYGAAIRNVAVVFQPASTTIGRNGTTFFMPTRKRVPTDTNGLFQINLLRTSAYLSDTTNGAVWDSLYYEVSIEWTDSKRQIQSKVITDRLYVPDSTTFWLPNWIIQ